MAITGCGAGTHIRLPITRICRYHWKPIRARWIIVFSYWAMQEKTITLNAGLSAIAGYETINRSKTMLYDGSIILDKNNFIYRPGGRLSLKPICPTGCPYSCKGRTKVVWGTDLKQFRPSAGVGLRFNF